jgi:histidinol-phosphate phosphatase family protein
VINRILYHRELSIIDTPFTVKQFKLLPKAASAIRLLNRCGLKVFVVSNQPGVAKGHFDYRTLEGMNRKLARALGRERARLDGIYYCLHHPQARLRRLRRICSCRKPRIGLLLQAAREHGVDLKRSYMVGDGLTDIQAGRKAGCVTIFVGNWKADICQFMAKRGVKPDAVAGSLWEAARLVFRRERDNENIPGLGER